MLQSDMLGRVMVAVNGFKVVSKCLCYILRICEAIYSCSRAIARFIYFFPRFPKRNAVFIDEICVHSITILFCCRFFLLAQFILILIIAILLAFENRSCLWTTCFFPIISTFYGISLKIRQFFIPEGSIIIGIGFRQCGFSCNNDRYNFTIIALKSKIP